MRYRCKKAGEILNRYVPIYNKCSNVPKIYWRFSSSDLKFIFRKGINYYSVVIFVR